MNYKKIILYGLFPLLFISCTACSSPIDKNTSFEELKILSWNVQNLFDDISNGTEYDEFNPKKSKWNSELMHIRLSRIKYVFDELLVDYPQIVLLQEVENENVLRLLNKQYLKDSYPWKIIIPQKNQAICTALLSSVPIKSVSTLETGYWGRVKLRPITEIHIDLSDETLILFNNHWKSKSGGAELSETARIQSAQTLTKRIKNLIVENDKNLIIAAGDFNENHNEYWRVSSLYKTALIPFSATSDEKWNTSLYTVSEMADCHVLKDKLTLFSPWFNSVDLGSYSYKSKWSKIDHFFLWKSLDDGEGFEYSSFQVLGDPSLLDTKANPARWNSLTGVGYSDHLPILLTLIKEAH